MKVTKQDSFTPVVITLESQDEVNKFAALLRNSPTVDTLGLNNYWEKLDSFASEPETSTYVDKVEMNLRKEYKSK